MRAIALAIVIISVMACSTDATLPAGPSDPAPARRSSASLLVTVIEHTSGICLEGAIVEIVQGEGVGRRAEQRTPCTYWDPDYDARFDGLSGTVDVTLRASAPGYVSADQVVTPARWPSGVTFTLLPR